MEKKWIKKIKKKLIYVPHFFLRFGDGGGAEDKDKTLKRHRVSFCS